MPKKRKSILKRCAVEVAKGKRTCKNSGQPILKGEVCLVVWDDTFDQKPYSKNIARLMIDDAHRALGELSQKLGL